MRCVIAQRLSSLNGNVPSFTHSGKAILVFKAPDKPVKTSDDVKGKKSKTEDKKN